MAQSIILQPGNGEATSLDITLAATDVTTVSVYNNTNPKLRVPTVFQVLQKTPIGDTVVGVLNNFARSIKLQGPGVYRVKRIAGIGEPFGIYIDKDNLSTAVVATGLTLAPTTVSIAVGSSSVVVPTVAPANATDKSVIWKSSAPAVAKVDRTGKVTGVSPGTATITGTTSNGLSATVATTVTAAVVAVSGLSVYPGFVQLGKGVTQQMTADIQPANASNKTLTWASSDTSVATVSSTGVVTTLQKTGSALITATSNNAKVGAATVKVVEKVVNPTSVKVTPASVTLNKGQTQQMSATVSPVGSSQAGTWSSSSPAVTVSVSGLVKAVTPDSSAIITFTTANGKKSSATVVVGHSTSTGILRSVANNRYPNYVRATDRAQVTNNCSRFGYYIGSGRVKRVKLMAVNTYVWLASEEKPGNAVTILNTFMEMPGKTSKRITWAGGSNGLEVANGAYLVESDWFEPSQLDLDSFEWGTQCFIRSEISVPANGKIVSNESWDTYDAGGHIFNPAVAQCSNIGGTGPLLYTGTTSDVTSFQQSWSFLLVGEYENGDPLVGLGIGDSQMHGASDESTGMGKGFEARSRIGTDWSTAYSGINFGRPSGHAGAWQNSPAALAATRLCNYGLEGYLTNNFPKGQAANDNSVNYWFGQSKNIWALVKGAQVTAEGARPFQMYRVDLYPRTDAPTGPTVADQVLFDPNWGAGGDVEKVLAKFKVDTGHDGFIPFASIVRASQVQGQANYYLWDGGNLSTEDGTHALRTKTVPLGAFVRSFVQARAA